MSELNALPASRGWYRRFVEHLDPGERLGELLFGLIMVLTFTLGAGIELAGDREATSELLIAALGCNAAWGIIDAALFLMGRLSERGRVHRLVRKIQAEPGREQALALVDRELDERIPAIVRKDVRLALDAEVLDRVREMKLERNRLTADDAWAGLAVFWLVFLTALPAVLPFLVLRDAQIAMRASNALLIGLLFYVGWRWAAYTGASRWGTALFVALLGVALVAVAIALGG
jgi:VIT1/CCC1 family predicted Fe2+/Mn2+ transporter